MDPVLAARINRAWPLAVAIVATAVFAVVHATVFRQQADHYRMAIARAAQLGLVVDPARPSQQPPLPLKVYAVLMTNSLAPADADARSQAGTLGAQLAQTLSSMASRRGLDVEVAEPGSLTQLPGSVEMRAHLRLRGRYPAFVALVDDLAHDDRLWALERFTVTSIGPGRDEFDVFVASCLLMRKGSSS
jgi:hypothetical protein